MDLQKQNHKTIRLQKICCLISVWLFVAALTLFQNVSAKNHHAKLTTEKATLKFCSNLKIVSSAMAVAAPPSELTVSTVSSSALELSWADNSNDETGFKVERSLNPTSDFEPVAVLAANSTYFMQYGLSPATTYYYRVSAINADGEPGNTQVGTATTNANEAELPHQWTSADIGSPRFEGSASYTKGFFETKGNGWMQNNYDNFHFVYQPLKGDGEIVAQITWMLKAHWDHQGIMIRETLADSSQYAMAEFYRSKRACVFRARANGNYINQIDESVSYDMPVWLKLVRSGNTFIAYSSKKGKNWVEIQRQTISMGEDTYVGLVSHTNSDDKTSKATWRDVSVSHGENTLAHPTGLKAEVSPTDEITLSWSDNSNNETGFRIERAINGDTILFEPIAELGPNTTSYTDDGLKLGNKYFYRVRAVNNDMSSFPSNEEKAEVLEIPHIVFYMQRLAGDYDRTSKNNVIKVTTTADTVNNVLRHPGMIGKQINVTLEEKLTTLNASISFKIMPNTHGQTIDFLKSDLLSIRQVENQISVMANGEQRTYNVFLDSVTCNHIVLRFNNGKMTPYVNGQYFEEINVGEFDISSFTLGEYNGNIWDVMCVDAQLSDETINDISARCTNAVEPSYVPNSGYPYRHHAVYSCLWVQTKEQLQEEKKRAYLYAQDIAYDRNTFDARMYDHSDLTAWVNRERNTLSAGFDYFTFDRMFPEGGNTDYWLHENFHAYQVPLLHPANPGKWMAEASADWAIWNFYKKPLKSAWSYTLNPHYGVYEIFPVKSLPVVRYYHAGIWLAYITEFLADEGFIGEVYNDEIAESYNLIERMSFILAKRGVDYDESFAEFAARTAAWDYPNPKISTDFEADERKAINSGHKDDRFVNILSEVGTYGIFTPVPKEYQPGSYAWNAFRIDSTAASTYTIKLKGSVNNPESLKYIPKVITGTKGAYAYYDLPVSKAVTLGNGEAQIKVSAKAGEQLFLVVTAISKEHLGPANIDFEYEYAIESSNHILPKDHIRRFILPEETGLAQINHENYTVNTEVERGTDVTRLTPTVILSEGAASIPESGQTVDFTERVDYQVTGPGSTAPKEWQVDVRVVPPRTGTDFITFELKDVARFATINEKDHTVTINLLSDIDLKSVKPIFTLSDGATCQPKSGETINLTKPLLFQITAEDGINIQYWTVKTEKFRPFITEWKAQGKKNVDITLGENYNWDFEYTWKNANGEVIANNTFKSDQEEGGVISATLPKAGTYTLEIIGDYPYFSSFNYKDMITDVLQWGDIPWRSMFGSFRSWPGESFSATDVPNLRLVSDMGKMFEKAGSFNGDLSKWDVRNVSNMSGMFYGAKAFSGDISNWDVRNLVGANQMFREARAFNSDISGWSTGNLKSMQQMFFAAGSFDRSLGGWDISNVVNMTDALKCGLSQVNYDRTLIGWASQEVKYSVQLGAGGNKYCNGEEARSYLTGEKEWVITDAGMECPDVAESNILFIEMDGMYRYIPVLFDDENQTIKVVVVPGTDLTRLAPKLILSKGATCSPASKDSVDFTNPVVYTVTSANGTKKSWTVTVTIAVAVSTEPSEKIEKLLYYPNPTNGQLTIELQSIHAEDVEMSLYNLMGQAVPFQSNQNGRLITVNFEGQKGMYIMRIRMSGKTQAIKILKE